MHLDKERLERALHGELPEEEVSVAWDHLGECSACRSRLHQAKEEEAGILDLLASLDHPTSTPPLSAIRSKARVQQHRWGRWAAGVILALGATSAAYAAPGSPLPALVQRITQLVHSSSPAPAQQPLEIVPFPSPSGIAVPAGGFLSVQFSSLQARGRITVELTDRPEVVVRAMGGSPTFTADLDRLLIGNDGSLADFQIDIPRDAPRIEVRVGGEVRFSREGGRVTAGPPADGEGRFQISLQAGTF